MAISCPPMNSSLSTIEFVWSLSKVDMLLQLKISHELENFDVIDKSWMSDCYVYIYNL
jgi:hypothetical protein